MPGGWGSDEDELDQRSLLEAGNGHEQMRMVRSWVRRGVHGRPVNLNVDRIRLLNGIAMKGILARPWELRTCSDLEIFGSRHVLPPHEHVRELLEDACSFVESQAHADPIFLAAYVLWRICWIHPFEDGNGRTARAASYFVLSNALRLELPGNLPIPARIKQAPRAYTRALESADAAWAEGRLDVSIMRGLLEHYLRAQLNNDPPGLPPGS